MCKKKFNYYISNRSGKYCSKECMFISPEFRKKQSLTKTGKKHTEEAKLKMSITRKGKKQNEQWIKNRTESRIKNLDKNGRKTPDILLLKSSKKYKDWRTSVFQRDNYTCQKCGDNKGGNLEAHHIIALSFVYKEFKLTGDDSLLFDIDNGTTLCKDCHKKTDSYAKHSSCIIENKLIDSINKLWETTSQTKTADQFYLEYMEKLISSIKEKLS